MLCFLNIRKDLKANERGTPWEDKPQQSHFREKEYTQKKINKDLAINNIEPSNLDNM